MRFLNRSLKASNVFQEEAKTKAEAEKTKAEEAKTKAEAEKAKKDVSDLELHLINTTTLISAGRQIQGRGRQTEEGGEIFITIPEINECLSGRSQD